MAKVEAKTRGICSLMYAKYGQAVLDGPYNSEADAINRALLVLDDDEITKIFLIRSDHQVKELEGILTLIVVVGAKYEGTGLDFYSVKVRCTVEDQDAGRHYAAAIEYIKTQFADHTPVGPFFVFDEHDSAFQHIDATDLCDSLDIITVKRSQTKTPSKKGK